MNDAAGSPLRVHKLPRKVVTYNNAWGLFGNFLSLRCVKSNDGSLTLFSGYLLPSDGQSNVVLEKLNCSWRHTWALLLNCMLGLWLGRLLVVVELWLPTKYNHTALHSKRIFEFEYKVELFTCNDLCFKREYTRCASPHSCSVFHGHISFLSAAGMISSVYV